VLRDLTLPPRMSRRQMHRPWRRTAQQAVVVSQAQPARSELAGNQDPDLRRRPVVPVVAVHLAVPATLVPIPQAQRARLSTVDHSARVAVATPRARPEVAGNQDPDLKDRGNWATEVAVAAAWAQIPKSQRLCGSSSSWDWPRLGSVAAHVSLRSPRAFNTTG
jgi:hypothetical protein